jgi:hypothetical protein
MGGVGVVGAVLGTVFGVQAFGNSDDSAAHCTTGTPDLCNETGLQLRSDATKAANVSTVAFALGGAAVAGGVVLFVAAPSKDTRHSRRHAIWRRHERRSEHDGYSVSRRSVRCSGRTAFGW